METSPSRCFDPATDAKFPPAPFKGFQAFAWGSKVPVVVNELDDAEPKPRNSNKLGLITAAGAFVELVLENRNSEVLRLGSRVVVFSGVEGFEEVVARGALA